MPKFGIIVIFVLMSVQWSVLVNEKRLSLASRVHPLTKTRVDNKFFENPDPEEKYLELSKETEQQSLEKVPNNGPDSGGSANIQRPTQYANMNLSSSTHGDEINYYKMLSHKISLIISPILLIIGGIGNPLCIVILLRKRKPNSTIIYLCLLAVFDILVLFTGLLRQYLKEIIDVDLRDFSTFTCKLHVNMHFILCIYYYTLFS